MAIRLQPQRGVEMSRKAISLGAKCYASQRDDSNVGLESNLQTNHPAFRLKAVRQTLLGLRSMPLILDRRDEVALKCPGGTKAISLGFQPEVSVAHQHLCVPEGRQRCEPAGAGPVHDF